ncbi:exosome complex component RRP4-like [Paramacrobiotus metropolitanus]|uniref:exosome complex component RRP4-like n=1 Tax=Paramacrobiotus metropolitanus TaxID=2943436 RepID=UPI002445EA98|nr:exosome complex component RRP4-like [Paramacrobiotus metropolitanus]
MAVNIAITAKRATASTGSALQIRDEEMPEVSPPRKWKQPELRDNQVYIPGDTVMENAEGWMDGHGSYCSVLPEKRVQMLASVAGIRQIYTRVVVINPIRSRYIGEIGDIIVGRIIQVGRKAWMVDVGAQRHGILNLGGINLPSGELRRKTEEDIGFMRGYLKEGDLISAEVQKTGADGRLVLHTRSLRYGRLVHGMLLQVQPKLTRRGKGHFISYETFGVHLIIGVNGAIWIAPTQRQLNIPLGLDQGEQVRTSGQQHFPEEEDIYVQLTDTDAKKVSVKMDDTGQIPSSTKSTSVAPLEVRKCMARIRNCIGILDNERIPINRETIRILYDASMKYEAKYLLQSQIAKEIFLMARSELAQEMPGAQRDT